jgi:DNA-binding CsgD family transcriptional regulator
MSAPVVGRQRELAAIERLIEGLSSGPRALVLEGAPGIGKTTVWQRALAAPGVPVLSCRPVEAEAKLAFASLSDLLAPVADAELPEPQRHALDVALLRESPRGAPPDRRAVGTAVATLLAQAAPLILAMDDVQWLDRASAAALAFALRRVGDRPVGVVAAVRVEAEPPADPLALDHAFEVERLRLGPLDAAELHDVIRGRLDLALSRPALQRIARASEGNPLYALELARAGAGPGEPMAVRDSLAALLTRRLAGLPARSREALLGAAALSSPSIAIIEGALGSADGLARAEKAGVIELAGGQVRFTHPLLASAVYASAGEEERRRTHARLAEAVDDLEQRARHLALAASAPDDEVAALLDAAAAGARARGAPDAAAELLERAAALSTTADARRARAIHAAEHFFHAGDRGRAREMAEDVLAEGPDGAALRLLGLIHSEEDSFPEAIALFEQALEHGDSVALRLNLAFALATTGDAPSALAHADHALALAEERGERAEALAVRVTAGFVCGQGADWAAFERALELEDRDRPVRLHMRPSALYAQMLVYTGRLAEGRAALREICDWALERGEEAEVPFLMAHVAWLEWWSGNFDAATQTAVRMLALAAQSGSVTTRAIALVHRAVAAGFRGEVEASRADLATGWELMEAAGWTMGKVWVLTASGFLELSLGDAHAAIAALAPLIGQVEAIGVAEPVFAECVPDAIEALAATGELERAEALLALFEPRARALERSWALSCAARCTALLRAARGDLDGALAAAQEAVATPIEMPVEHARALIALGAVQRRRRERKAARETLRQAVEELTALGAPLWAERAEAELRRVPIRRSAGPGLTPSELAVAELVAAGRTNREVAQELFISHKTVEANLSRVYRKLGIHSRAELGARMAKP